MNKEIPNKELLKSLMDELGSMGKVAVYLGRSYGTVRAWYNKYKLNRPESNRTVYHELRNVDFSIIQKSVVLGSILGDGGLHIPKKGKNALLYIKHCSKQKPYLIWKKELLDPFSRPVYKTSDPGIVYINGVQTHDSGSFATYTISHPTLTEFYEKFYHGGKKGVHESVIENLDLLALSIWLSDDGSFYSDSRFNGVCGGKICTNSFSYKEQLILVEAVKKFYGNDGINIIPHNKDKTQYVIKFTNSENTSMMLKSIREVLPECIHYKLDPQRLHAKPLINN